MKTMLRPERSGLPVSRMVGSLANARMKGMIAPRLKFWKNLCRFWLFSLASESLADYEDPFRPRVDHEPPKKPSGHFASRDGVHWAQLPAAIWNGLEVLNLTRINQTRVTRYDTDSIYTGSSTLVPGLAPDGASPGVLMVYPGLCRRQDWQRNTNV